MRHRESLLVASKMLVEDEMGDSAAGESPGGGRFTLSLGFLFSFVFRGS